MINAKKNGNTKRRKMIKNEIKNNRRKSIRRFLFYHFLFHISNKLISITSENI